jgi:hypothetical protein
MLFPLHFNSANFSRACFLLSINLSRPLTLCNHPYRSPDTLNYAFSSRLICGHWSTTLSTCYILYWTCILGSTSNARKPVSCSLDSKQRMIQRSSSLGPTLLEFVPSSQSGIGRRVAYNGKERLAFFVADCLGLFEDIDVFTNGVPYSERRCLYARLWILRH